MTDPRNTAQWKRLRKRLVASASHCAICGRALDHNARPRSRWSPSVDHIVPIARGGPAFDPANCRTVHYGCNARKAAHIRNYGTDTPPPTPAPAAPRTGTPGPGW